MRRDGEFLFGHRSLPILLTAPVYPQPDRSSTENEYEKTQSMVFLFNFLDQKAPFSPTMEEETKQFGERTRGKYCHGFYKKHQKKNVNIKTSFWCVVWWQNPLCGNHVVLFSGYFVLHMLLPCPELHQELRPKRV